MAWWRGSCVTSEGGVPRGWLTECLLVPTNKVNSFSGTFAQWFGCCAVWSASCGSCLGWSGLSGLTTAGSTCSWFLLGMVIHDALDDVLRGIFDAANVGEEFLRGVLLLVPLVKVGVDEILPLPVLLGSGLCPGSIDAPSLVLFAVEKDLGLVVPLLGLDDRLEDVQLGAEGSNDLPLVHDSSVLSLKLGS